MKISHSDIKSLNKCEFRWYYERHLNLIPVAGLPLPMEVGTFGHSLMEESFKVLQAGGTFEEATAAAGALLQGVTEPAMMKVFRNVLAFVAYFQEQPWRVHQIEDKGSYVFAEGKEFGFTPDLVVEILDGPLKGQFIVVDYKFTGQYWVDREVNMHSQVPKYMLYKKMRDGLDIKRGLIVMLNTRAKADTTGTDLFLLKWITPSTRRLENLHRENENMIDRILMLKKYAEKYGDEELRLILTHTGDEKQCKMCHFADDICPMQFDGKDITRVIKRNYKQNDTYGYNGEMDGNNA